MTTAPPIPAQPRPAASGQRVPPFRLLDAIRGFAAIWVVMDHSCAAWLSTHEDAIHRPLYAFSIRGQIGVVFFFVISGYCITAAAYGALRSDKSALRYAYERCRRIFPPYLAAMALLVAMSMALLWASAHHLIPTINHPLYMPHSVWLWSMNLLLLQGEFGLTSINQGAWSLTYEVAFYGVIGLLLIAARWQARRKSLAAGTSLFVAGLGLSTLVPLVFMLATRTAAIFPFDLWHQFSLGGLLFFLLEATPATVPGSGVWLQRLIRYNCAAAALMTLVFALVCDIGPSDLSHPNSTVRSLCTLAFVACLAGLRRFDELISSQMLLRPLMWVGAFSYSLYLSHGYVLGFVDILMRRAGFDGGRYWITFWVEVAFAVGFGYVFFLLFERRFLSKRHTERLVEEQVLA